MPGMGGVNMNMVKQVQKMQQDMQKMQAELEAKEYTAAAGGGVVSATVSGKRELIGISIDPEAVDPEDVEMLQDMIVAAVTRPCVPLKMTWPPRCSSSPAGSISHSEPAPVSQRDTESETWAGPLARPRLVVR